VLLKAEKLAEALRTTGSAIPALLLQEREVSRKLGVCEIEGGDITQLRARLDAVSAERSAAARKRSSASEALLMLDRELGEVRTELDRARQLYGEGIAAEFGRRWQAACSLLAALRSEAESLGKALGRGVLTPPPYMARVNPITDAPEVQVVASGPIQPPPLPEAVRVAAGIMDRIDAARGLAAAVHQSRQLTAHYFALSRERGLKSELGGLFETVREFEWLGSKFPAGALLDRTILAEGMLHRFWQGKTIRPVSEGRAAVAA
jgi:hypothetical protein